VDVAPTKLEFASEYQQMLGQIADVATEALLQWFAPAALTLAQDAAQLSRLDYQQFAFLSARLASRDVQDALALIIASPHRAWEIETELQTAGRPLPNTSALSRAIARPGSRVPTHGRLRVPSVPRMVERRRTDATIDSVPNRFVKYALERWRTIAQNLIDRLGGADSSIGPVRRGTRVAREVRDDIDHVLAAPFFAQVGPLGVFPTANQVLNKQRGYREIFRTFALGEMGARLSLHLDVDDAFAASQRNVATLYEYWAFMQLVEAVGVVCGERRTVEALTASSDGLSLAFKQGAQSGVRWDASVAGRRLDVEVFFNRHFRSARDNATATSWSRAMRPDCSIRIRPKTGLPDDFPGSPEVWLHFDAKYRVERAPEQFDASAGAIDEVGLAAENEAIERLGRSKREDLLKMHAYRDAIRGSAGAYVIFPGDRSGVPFREFAEPLPGLGAFALRPGEDGAIGRGDLEAFLREAFEHVADRASQDERYRYWRAVVRGQPEPGGRGDALPQLSVPPRDADLLCRFFTNRDEHEWVSQIQLYAIPADEAFGGLGAGARELGAFWALFGGPDFRPRLWSREGPWFVQSAEQLEDAGHPRIEARAYLCATVLPAPDEPEWLAEIELHALRAKSGHGANEQFIATWAELLEWTE
jgi:predicted component of viral defense system (DUF524 family)